MEFANIAYVSITSMTLVSSIKLIKEGYDRDLHTKTLVHVATGKKVCDIEKHFGVMTLEFNLINESTATVEKTVPQKNEVLNQTPNKKIEVLIDQAPMKGKEVKKTPQSINISEPITHGKSDRKHIMELNQSDERQRNPSLNNPHSSRQVDSESGDHLTKALSDGLKERFTKTPNMKNGGPKKQAKSPDITRHTDSNRTEKA
jgi:hypothetical protein